LLREVLLGLRDLDKMIKQLALMMFGIALVFSIMSQISFVSAVPNFCCEKTINGAWCQNTLETNCNAGKDLLTNISFRKIPSSCEATSYCSLGTCYNSQEGTCMENTPQRVCQDNGGRWDKKPASELPQCQLGCCLIGDQAAFVTQTRCKRLAALYGLETDFRTNINNEAQCIASAKSSVKGACVFEEDFQTTCKFISQEECSRVTSENGSAEFFEDKLCSSEELGTICGPSEKTTCVEGRDEVFFVDTCGNLANIYDALKIKDKVYWSKVISRDESCNPSLGNANSDSCGNCNYYLGSTCKAYSRTENRKPLVGNNICKDLACEYKGVVYQHGETWCADVPGINNSLPGSRAFRMVCYNGEVTNEPCADFRQEVCVQDSLNGFKVAGCVVNRWQDCVSQEDKNDCENRDRRDCKWVSGATVSCAPLNPPGFDFWNSEGSADSTCKQATAVCTVKCTEGLSGGKECESDLNCVDSGGKVTPSWENAMNTVCSSLGDCGVKKNFVGTLGFQNGSAIKVGKSKGSEDK